MKISAFAVAAVAVFANQSSGFFFRPIPIPLFKPIPLRWNLGGGGGGGGQGGTGNSCPTPTCPTPQCPTPVCPAPECPLAPECEQRAQDIDSCEGIGMIAVFKKDGSLHSCL